MKRTSGPTLAAILLAAWALMPRPALAQKPSFDPAGTIEGRASLEGKTPGQARAQAIEQAFRTQVMAGVAARLPEKVRIEKEKQLEDEIYSHAEDFILRYQIEDEQTQGTEYVVSLDLALDQGMLDAALAKGGFLRSPHPPKVFLLILEQRPPSPAQSWWSGSSENPAPPSASEQVFRQELGARGYQVIEPSPGLPRVAPERVTNPGDERDQILRQLQSDYDADFLLVGKARILGQPGGTQNQAELTLAGVDLATGESLFRLERTLAVEKTRDENFELKALTAAAQALAPEVLKRLSQRGLVLGGGKVQAIQLTVLNVFSYPVYQALSERLEHPIPGVRKAELRRLSPGRAIFLIQGSVEPGALVRALTAEFYPGFRLEEVEVSGDSIRLTASALPGTSPSP